MKKTVVFTLSLLLIINLFTSIVIFAVEEISERDEARYKEIKLKINSDVEEALNRDNRISSIFVHGNELIEEVPYTETTEVVIDLRNDLDAIKLSFSEPVTIYEEVTTRTYHLDQAIIENYDLEIQGSSSELEYRAATFSRTYNGETTTVDLSIGFYIEENVYVNDALVNAYSLQSSDADFYSTGYGNISHIAGIHHQRGARYPGGGNHIVIDGNQYSSHTTDESFSTYTSSGNAHWSIINNEFSALEQITGTGGYVGSFYTVTFVWNLGGGQYGYDEVTRDLGFGNLPT